MTVEPMNALVRRLREQRRMKQHELADKAGFDVQVVSRIEQNRGNVRSLTARALFQALAAAKPLRETEAHDFLSQCGLIPASPTRSLPPRELHDYVTEGLVVIVPEPPATFADLADHETPTPPIARLARQLELAVGLERASFFLQAAVRMLEPAAAAPPSPMLVKPPVVVEGFTVQEFAPVKPVAPPPKARSAPTRKAR
jgi:transcriptional regulator with XRE-family HTH domain